MTVINVVTCIFQTSMNAVNLMVAVWELVSTMTEASPATVHRDMNWEQMAFHVKVRNICDGKPHAMCTL